MAGWYVAQFIEESSVEVIPSNWILNFNQCVWPNNLGPLKIAGAIRNNLKPSKDWKKYSIRILCKTLITDFHQATSVANKAQFTSDSEALIAQESTTSIKRKRLPKKKNVSSPMSSDEDVLKTNENSKQVSLPDFPQLKKNNGKSLLT